MNDIIDSHCHLYYEPFLSNLKFTIDECKSNNINVLLSIAVDYETSLKNIEISKKHDEIYCTIGLHPNNVANKMTEIDKILNLYGQNNKIVGIGECGIDLYRSNDNLSEQIKIFEKHVDKSIKENAPLIIHTRSADEETYNVLKKFKNYNLTFIIHCFSSDYTFAKRCIDLGGSISFSGNITFKNSANIQSVCKKIPLDKILVETDSPYLSPEPYRGKVNNPKNTYYVAKKISEIRGISLDQVASQTTTNFIKIFKISN
jgi:TatD DNase family protein